MNDWDKISIEERIALAKADRVNRERKKTERLANDRQRRHEQAIVFDRARKILEAAPAETFTTWELAMAIEPQDEDARKRCAKTLSYASRYDMREMKGYWHKLEPELVEHGPLKGKLVRRTLWGVLVT